MTILQRYADFVEHACFGGDDLRDRMLLGAVGLAGETGEVCEVVKKSIFHGDGGYPATPLPDSLLLELGDTLWYLQLIANEAGYTLDEVIDTNMRKLIARRPEQYGNPDRWLTDDLKPETKPQTIEDIIQDVIAREGGYVDDPDDAGGATKHGVSLRYAKGKGLVMDLDGDGDVDAQDIQLVTPEKAMELYKRDFFFKPQIHRLPGVLHPLMVDFAINSGPRVAIEHLQTEINYHCRSGERIEVDGIIGVKTIDKLMSLTSLTEDQFTRFINDLVFSRCGFLKKIVQKDPSQEKFLDGWIARAESFRTEF